MPQGVNGDLADITFYTATTPVFFTTSNVPLDELNNNVLILDTKLESYIESGLQGFSEAGDGTFTTTVNFAELKNNIPNITVSLGEVSGTLSRTLFLQVTNRTLTSFDIEVIGFTTTGAWTANVHWWADGR